MRVFAMAALGTVLTGALAVAQDRQPEAPPPPPVVQTRQAEMLMLLRRSDVQNGLGLSMRQRRELNQVLSGATQDVTNQSAFQHEYLTGDGPDRPPASGHAQPQQRDNANQAMALLTESQKARLNELWYQWRGPLVMAEPEVAGRLQLNQETRRKIGEIAAEYAKIRTEVFQSLTQRGQIMSSDGYLQQHSEGMGASELDRPFSPARRKLTRAKKNAEERILALLTEEEKARWNRLCGSPFSFRTDLPGLRF